MAARSKRHPLRPPPRLYRASWSLLALGLIALPLAYIRITGAFDAEALAYQVMLRLDNTLGDGASLTFVLRYASFFYLDWPEWLGGRAYAIPHVGFDATIFLIVTVALWLSGRKLRKVPLALLFAWAATNGVWESILWRHDYFGMYTWNPRSTITDTIDATLVFLTAATLIAIMTRSSRVLFGAIVIGALGVVIEVSIRADLLYTEFSYAWLFILVTTLTLDTLRTRRAIRRKLNPNLCTNCGYDLTGIAPNTPCPECGAKPLKPQPPAATQENPSSSQPAHTRAKTL